MKVTYIVEGDLFSERFFTKEELMKQLKKGFHKGQKIYQLVRIRKKDLLK